jgi:ribosomal protein S18 acetylase RimI-like enzyme
LIQYRPFLNTDLPLVVDLWPRLGPVQGLIGAIDEATLEKHIFSKIYFDRNGFFVATEAGRIVGFAHGGFPPKDDLSDLDKSCGVVCQMRIQPRDDRNTISQHLLKLVVDYCRSKGAKKIYAGCRFPYSPFYLGIYGGSRHPGILDTDSDSLAAFTAFGFSVFDQVIVMERMLDGFKTISDRQQMTVRRGHSINASTYPIEQSWWESCTLGTADRERFTVVNKRSKEVNGSVSFWDLKPQSLNDSRLSRGLYGLQTTPEFRRQGLATYLVGESLKHLASMGVARVEAQTEFSDLASLKLFTKLGFQQIATSKLMALQSD